jgi:dipeptidyl aminopeptidase/acylaminoacyl peptidase
LTEAPDWSSTGRVAFGRYGDLYCRPDCENIWVTRLGGKPRRLTYRGGSSPSWSPHGTKLAFVRARSRRGVVRRDIYVVRRDGRGLGRLTRRGGDSPSWSPDGRWIAFNPRWRRLRGSQQRRRPPPPGERATARPRGPDRDLTGLAASAARLARPKPTRTRVPKSFTGTARGHAPSAYDRERERKSRPTTPDELHERTAAVLLLDEPGCGGAPLRFHKLSTPPTLAGTATGVSVLRRSLL